jgi:prophage tail gpP-like protein
MPDIVTLTVNGLDYSGWKSIRIEAGVERLARSFELSVTDKWPGSVEQVRRIGPGDLCEVKIDEDLVCTGYVDATPIDYDANGITIMVRGRSKTADLIDCSADNATGQFRGLSAEAIAKKLASQYGLDVVTETASGAAITDHQIQQGETVFESLDRIAKQRQILVTDNAAGDLVLASPGSGGQAQTALDYGGNVLSASAGFDFSEVYSSYTVKGQKAGTDDSYGAQAAQSSGNALDGSIKRRRVLIVRQTGQADANTCKQRAQYEQQVRAAKANEIRYRVAGWRQENGALWQPNQVVEIRDMVMRINASMLVSEVIYTLDESGLLTELIVIPAAAFATEPEQKAQAAKRKQTNAGGTIADWPD